MSPQFVDFNGDGQLDLVAGIFDGSPHVAFGSAEGFTQPEQILDKGGQRIVMNQFWNFDTKKWDSTNRCDPEGAKVPGGHLTSAWAFDWDADGDLDLLLGDHSAGSVMLRRNEGTATAPAFAVRNEPVLCDGEPLVVPGTVTTLRLLDWDGDGLDDLLVGSMGDPYGTETGGGVFLHHNSGKRGAPQFDRAVVLVEPSRKGAAAPTRPDAGLYMDAADPDGDGDLDLVVGGYAMWTPPAPQLDAAQQARVGELQKELEAVAAATQAIFTSIEQATADLEETAVAARRSALLKERQQELADLGQQRRALTKELEPMLPGAKRRSFVWFYENLSARAAAPLRR